MLHLHLVLVHVPVVALPLVGLGHFIAFLREDTFWQRVFEGAWLFVALVSVAAYFTGGSAFEQLRNSSWKGATGEIAQKLAEDHAIIGRSAFLLMVLAGAFVLQMILNRFQDQEPARWQHWLLAGLGLAGCALLIWTAALGGPIEHVQLR